MAKNSTKKNSNLSKYTAVAGAVIASGAVNSQVVYTDITDVVVDKNNATGYQLDFNNDATADVVLAVQNNVASGTFPYTTSSGSVMNIAYTVDASYAVAAANAGGGLMGSGSSSFNVTALNNGDQINNAGGFGGTLSSPGMLAYAGSYTLPSFSYSGTFAGGNFIGATDKFIGAKFTAGLATHYGWIRVDVAADASTITVKDFAYNSTADAAINAGEMANLENFAVENKVTIKTHLDEAFINVTPDLIGGELVIINMAGQEVKSSVIGDVNAKITYDGLDTGIYTLVARFESGSVNKKIYVR